MTDNYTVTITLQGRDNATRAVEAVNRALRQTAAESQGARLGFGGVADGAMRMNNAITGAVTAFAGLQLFQQVAELNNLGREVAFVEARFNALTGGGGALQKLREQTGGVIDDMTLMRDATGLILTGMAADAEEAGRLIALGFQLGGEAGVDALQRALKNNSIEMLDNLGISAAAVRELRDEFIAAGMDSATAFARATLEIGEQTRDNLGDAARAAETSWGRVQTRIENATLEVGKFINRGVEAGAMLAELAMISFDQDIQRRLEDFANWVWSSQGIDMTFDQFNALVEAERRRQASRLETATRRTPFELEFSGRYQDRYDTARLNAAAEQLLAPVTRQRMLAQELAGIAAWESPDDMPQYMTAGQAALIQVAADDAQRLYEAARAAKEDGAFFNDAQLEAARQAADETKRIADEAERAARAFETMTLAQAFGQGVRNPLIGDLTGGALGALRDSGRFDDTQLQQFQDALDLNSGAQTDVSLMYRDDILPMLADIAAEFGSEGLKVALNNLEAELRNAALAGRAPDLEGRIGFGYRAGGGGFTVRPGDTPSGISAATGIPLADVMRIAGITDPTRLQPGDYAGGGDLYRIAPVDIAMAQYRAGERADYGGAAGAQQRPTELLKSDTDFIRENMAAITAAGEGYSLAMRDTQAATEVMSADTLPALLGQSGGIRTQMEGTKTATEQIKSNLKEMTAGVHVLTLDVRLIGAQQIVDWLTSNVATITRGNGGTTPGADGRRG